MVQYVAFGIIIDDIVLPDGQTYLGILGGGGPQTAFGMRLWSNSVGLVGCIGSDFPDAANSGLNQLDIDMTGVIQLGFTTTPRAWQVFEEDGRRTHVWRIPTGDVEKFLQNKSDTKVPKEYGNAVGFHVGIHTLAPSLPVPLNFFRNNNHAMISVETFDLVSVSLSDQDLSELQRNSDIFSPNILEARAMTGLSNPIEIIKQYHKTGNSLISLRMGEQGVLLSDKNLDYIVHIPAFSGKKVSPLGAGNAFCGGFLVGYCETKDITIAGLYGSVAASFMIEQIGVPKFSQSMLIEAEKRLKYLQLNTNRINKSGE